MSWSQGVEWDNDVDSSDEEDIDDFGRRTKPKPKREEVYQGVESEAIRLHNPADFYDFLDMPDDLIIVAFTASWNKSANQVLPVFDALTSEFDGDVSFVVDVDEMESQLAEAKAAYGEVPAFHFYKDGVCLKKLNKCEDPHLLESTWRKFHRGGGGGGEEQSQSTRNQPREFTQMKVFFSGPQQSRQTTSTTTTTTKKKDPFSSFMKSVEKAADKEFGSGNRSRKKSTNTSATSNPSPGTGQTVTTRKTSSGPMGLFGSKKTVTVTRSTHSSSPNTNQGQSTPPSTHPNQSEINDLFSDLNMMPVVQEEPNPNGPPPPIPQRRAAPRVAGQGTTPPRQTPVSPRQMASPSTPPEGLSGGRPRQTSSTSSALSGGRPRQASSNQTASSSVASTPIADAMAKKAAAAAPRKQSGGGSSPSSSSADSSSGKLPDYMKPIPRPDYLPNLPAFDKREYSKFECEWMIGHIKWHLHKVLANSKTIRERGLELTAEYQDILMRRVIASAKEIKTIVHVLRKLDTKVRSNLNRQDKMATDTDKMVVETIQFIQKCRGIAQGTADVAEFETAFNSFVTSVGTVMHDVKSIHFDQQQAFRLRLDL